MASGPRTRMVLGSTAHGGLGGHCAWGIRGARCRSMTHNTLSRWGRWTAVLPCQPRRGPALPPRCCLARQACCLVHAAYGPSPATSELVQQQPAACCNDHRAVQPRCGPSAGGPCACCNGLSASRADSTDDTCCEGRINQPTPRSAMLASSPLYRLQASLIAEPSTSEPGTPETTRLGAGSTGRGVWCV